MIKESFRPPLMAVKREKGAFLVECDGEGRRASYSTVTDLAKFRG